MRLATYHASGGVEVSVSRAGGTTEANIQRWIAQFDDVGRDARAEKTVRGLHVVTVDIAGTYVGGGHDDGGRLGDATWLGDGGRNRREPWPSVLLQDDRAGGGGSCGAPRVRPTRRGHLAEVMVTREHAPTISGAAPAMSCRTCASPPGRLEGNVRARCKARVVHLGRSWSKPERPIWPSPFSSSVAEAPPDRREKRGRRGRRDNPGYAGEAGTAGMQGPAGPMAMNAEAGVSIPVSCLSPCHGFNGVVSQFQTSVHYTEYLANAASATPETEWTAPGAPCGNCHAIDALQQRVTGNVVTVTTAASSTSRAASCSTAIRSTGALSSANYAGTATVAEVYCTTCHAVTNANDPHKTGIPWTPGSFPLQVADGRRHPLRREEPQHRPP